jgi:glutamate 5-kinase
MSFYKKEFKNYKISAAQLLVTRPDFADRKKYLNLRTVAENLLKLNIIPIFNENDVLLTEELDFSDNDELAAMISVMLGAERLIILTSVAGVYDKPPTEEGAKLLKDIKDIPEWLRKMGAGKTEMGKGGMRSKLVAAKTTTGLGIPTYVISGTKPRAILEIGLKNKKIGTFFPAIKQKKKEKPLKIWLRAMAESRGNIIVSPYLAKILKSKKLVSVLLAGVRGTKHNFSKNEVVNVCDRQGTVLARGQIRYGARELREELRDYQKSHKKGVRVKGGRKIVIHYDQLTFAL